MRKKSIEEDPGTLPPVTSSNRLSRFLPSCKLSSATVLLCCTNSHLHFPGTNLLLIFWQRFCTRNTATSPLTERSRGSKGRSPAQRRRGSGKRGPMGRRLHRICPPPAPFAHREVLLLHCGRTYLMFAAAVSWTTSAMKKENYRRRVKYKSRYVLRLTVLAPHKVGLLLLSKLRQSLSW